MARGDGQPRASFARWSLDELCCWRLPETPEKGAGDGVLRKMVPDCTCPPRWDCSFERTGPYKRGHTGARSTLFFSRILRADFRNATGCERAILQSAMVVRCQHGRVFATRLLFYSGTTDAKFASVDRSPVQSRDGPAPVGVGLMGSDSRVSRYARKFPIAQARRVRGNLFQQPAITALTLVGCPDNDKPAAFLRPFIRYIPSDAGVRSALGS